MRYSRQHKAETRARILQNAAEQLREKGAHGIGVADLMSQAGLTHGGFYAHFRSREALLIEALALAIDRSQEGWTELFDAAPEGQGLAALVEDYINEHHRDRAGTGCSMIALGSEATREGARARKMFQGKLERMIVSLSEQLEAAPRQAREQAITVLATMMGTMLMARIAGTGPMSEQILDVGHRAAMIQGGVEKPSRRRKQKAKALTKAAMN